MNRKRLLPTGPVAAYLAEAPGATGPQIVTAIGADPRAVVDALARLVRLGYVQPVRRGWGPPLGYTPSYLEYTPTERPFK